MALDRYYGGRSLSEVARTIREFNAERIQACVSALPRYRLNRAGIEDEKRKILGILPFLGEQGLGADVTVKLSQLGQRWNFDECVSALQEIARHCAQSKAFLWVDMEQSSLVDSTIEAFTAVAAEHENVGICLQTYLRRTERDAEAILKKGLPLRLVKGYYREWPPAAFKTWKETTDCFARLIKPLLRRSRKPTIGTHDETLLEIARKADSGKKVPRMEYQFFIGAKPRLPRNMAKEGHNVRVYIPYGALIPYLLHSLPYMDISRNIQRVLGVANIR